MNYIWILLWALYGCIALVFAAQAARGFLRDDDRSLVAWAALAIAVGTAPLWPLWVALAPLSAAIVAKGGRR